MPADVAAALLMWRDFLIVTAGASAVLLGLVFIGLSIHLEDPDMRNPHFLRSVASAESFLHPLLASMILVAPPIWPWLPGVALIGQSFLRVGGLNMVLVGVLRSPTKLHVGQLFKPFLLPFAGTISFALGSVVVVLGNADGLYLIALGMYVLIALGVQNAWDYLFGRRAAELSDLK